MEINTEAIRRLRDTLLFCDDLQNYLADKPEDGVVAPTTTREAAFMRRVEPFAETMFLVMMADGDIADVERKALAGALHVLTDGNISFQQLDSMLDRFEDNVKQQGSEARLMQIGTRIGGEREDRETAFTLAAVVALADERFDVREHRVLEWVKEYFGVSNHRAEAVLQSVNY